LSEKTGQVRRDLIEYIYRGERAPRTKEIKMAKMTPADLADVLGCTPKTCRKFLRSITPDRAGKGGRWVLDSDQTEMLVKRFAKWEMGRSTVFVIPADEWEELTD